jgi:hypothetical protein
MTDSTNNSSRIYFENSSSVAKGQILYSYTDDHMRFHTNVSERMRITSSGNVGIGTSSPLYDLHIADGSPILALEDTDTNTVFTLNASSTSGIIQYQADVTSVGANPEHWFRSQNRLLAKMHDNGDFSWYEDTGTTPKMFWDASAESLGIGTSSPGASLHINTILPQIRLTDTDDSNVDHFVNGSGSALTLSADENNELASSTLRFHVDGSEKMRIDSSGNVGIGTSSPDYKLQVDGDIVPEADNTYDLGKSSLVWANIYTGDLHLSNENKEQGNDIDGTKGNWTIQEGETDLYIINNKNGKKYKFNLEEIN